MKRIDLGTMKYRDAWAAQEKAHEQVLNGEEERVYFVEHPPVITFGRRPGLERNVLASDEQLAKIGVEVVQSDRGGDVTFHGPGQVVMYPIIRLSDHKLLVGSYVRRLLDSVVGALADFQVKGEVEKDAIGVWVGEGPRRGKMCALGVRIRRGVSLHGIALNVMTNLDYFNLIVPCGLAGRPVTSLEREMGARHPTLEAVKDRLFARFVEGMTESTHQKI
jgi:lipoyl(octanoyl) transferase